MNSLSRVTDVSTLKEVAKLPFQTRRNCPALTMIWTVCLCLLLSLLCSSLELPQVDTAWGLKAGMLAHSGALPPAAFTVKQASVSF